jgi:aspartyl-tRNA(Asn)/glutamyl-tRNA(Gln) amidotransferase subunit A
VVFAGMIKLRKFPISLDYKLGDTELAYLSAAEQGRLIRDRKLSPVELVRLYLVRIERYNPVLRAYITVCGDAALAAARKAEADIGRGDYRGPLHGIPFGVKDQLCTQGIRTTLGSRIYADHVPDFDATVITRLRDAGAILIGKENMHEFGKGGTHVFPHGQPRNPWDIERNPGSSSSGSGIAPAAGFCSGSLGEDTGGSIRGPAASNGVVGLRPTFGRVSRHGGVMYAWTADTLGPITRTVEDNALFLRAIAGYDAGDPLTSRRAVPNFNAESGAGIKGMRLAVVTEMTWPDGVHAETRTAMKAAIEVLRTLGATVEEVSLPWTRHAIPLAMLTSDADVASMYLPLLRSRWNEFDAGTRTRMAGAALVPAAVYSRAMRARAVVRDQIIAAFDRYDGLLSPTNLKPPGLIDDVRETVKSRDDVAQRIFLRRICTHPYGVANVPALAVPAGFTANGLPLSLQIAAKPFAEATVYRIGQAYERATQWHTKHPALEQTTRAAQPATVAG